MHHHDVDMIAVTGSIETGKGIARAAADQVKRVHLELGGKAPVLVFGDADLEAALETVAGTGYYNADQDCTAATRVLAARSVYDDVLGGLVDQAAGFVPGDLRSPETTLGPVNSARSTRPDSASASRASSRVPRITRRSPPAAGARTGRATSSSPPSSAAYTRAMRWSSARSSGR